MKTNLTAHTVLVARLTLVIGVIVGAVGVSCPHAAQPAIPAQIAALQEDVQTLQQQVKRLIDQVKTQSTTTGQLTAIVNSQSELIGLLQQQNQDLQAKLGCMSKTGNDVYFTACNVHVVSGSGATEGPVNGLGNLIIGYNEDAATLLLGEPTAPSDRGGSHNLVVGPGNSYQSYGGLVAGRKNRVAGANATVSGGQNNTAFGAFSSISAGWVNTAKGDYSSISGGVSNDASGGASSISGGSLNVARGGTLASAVAKEMLPLAMVPPSAEAKLILPVALLPVSAVELRTSPLANCPASAAVNLGLRPMITTGPLAAFWRAGDLARSRLTDGYERHCCLSKAGKRKVLPALLYAFVKTLSLTFKCHWQASGGIPMLVLGRSRTTAPRSRR